MKLMFLIGTFLSQIEVMSIKTAIIFGKNAPFIMP